MRVPLPKCEEQRLKAVARYDILDTPDEESFDRITRLAARLYDAPIAHMSIVAQDRVWCKSHVGSPVRETSRQDSFAGWAILSPEVLIVRNAILDERFSESIKLIETFKFHFYAAAPLITSDGFIIGVLAILDRIPRPMFTEEDAIHLQDLSALIVDQLELRRKTLQLRSSEADYYDLFEHCPIGIYRTSPDGRVLMGNPAILKMLGYPSVEAMKSINLESNLLVDSRSEWKRRLEDEGSVSSHESVWYSRDGRPIQICETARVVRQDDGSIAYYEGWAEDISIQKAAEAERKRATDFSYKLIEAVPDLIYIFDLAKERSVFTNRSYFEVIGQDPRYVQQLQNPIGELVHPEDISRLRNHRKQFRTTNDGEFLELEFRVRDLTGSYRLLSCRETIFSRDSTGTPHQLLGIIRDISDRRAMEERLRRDEDRWQLVLAANNDGLWDWDARTGDIFHSPRWREILGHENDSAPIEAWEELLHPEDALRVQQHLAAYLQREIPAYEQEYRLRTKGGDYRWVFARGVAQWDTEGKPTRMVGSHTDITERKEAELALRLQAIELADARDKAESAAEAKSSFLATMSHEIRTPLNGVIGMTTILSETDLTADQQDYLRTIRSSGSSLLAIINDILDFSKIEAGHMEIEEADFDLSSIIEDSLDPVAEEAARKSVELAVSIDQSVPKRVRGDSGRLRQIMLNLLSNAVKFTLQGEVVLAVTKLDSSNSSSLIRFAVSDTGIGMPTEVAARIFFPFSQADASTTRRFGGTGLGLAISKRLVELMGSQIFVESKEGVGSTFWFDVNLQPPQLPSKQLPGDRLENVRILIADDNATNLRIIQHSLESLGATVVCALDGFEALSALLDSRKSRLHIDMALLDFQMPRMDGLMLTRAIRAQRGFQHFPIVLLTSVTQRDHVQEAKELEIQGYLVKPIRNTQLIRTIRSLLQPRQGNTQSDETKHPPIAREALANEPYRVLLAEDNAVNRKVGVLMLTNLGYQVDVAINGREAVEAFQKFAYDAILLDCQMPEMDGFDATKLVRTLEPDGHRIPIIAITANALAGERERCLSAGMDDYVSKPISQKVLAEKLSALLRPEALSHQSRA